MRIAMIDFEMTNLVADFGIMLCGCVREFGGKTKVFRIEDYDSCWLKRGAVRAAPIRDRALVKALRDELQKYDIIVTWNGIKFDIPFLNSRLILQGLKPLEPMKHIDLLYTSRYKLRLHSNRLDAVAEYFETRARKTRLDGRQWIRARAGDLSALNYVVRHCMGDVAVLEEIYQKLKSQIRIVRAR